MKELTRFQIAAVKRTAQNVKPLMAKKEKLMLKIEEYNAQIEELDAQIAVWEDPIKKLSGGYTSAQILDGTRDAEMAKENVEVEATELSVNNTEENTFNPEN